MRILFIGPVPPPVTGHSLACRVLIDDLVCTHEVDLVDLSKDTLVNGVGSWARIADVLKIIVAVWRKQARADAIYLTLSESLAGNLKDVLIYLVCARRLGRVIVHLHGGSLRTQLFERHRWTERLNRVFLRRVGAAVVLGPTHRPVFSSLVPASRIYVVPNFAEDYLFVSTERVQAKFQNMTPLRVLFLGNLIQGKGFDVLVAAYCALDARHRQMIRIDFAGACESVRLQAEFLRTLEGHPHLHYHGVADSTAKRDLLCEAHVLCLPTSLSEGQPISILEAYAAGCAVMATDRGGIRDVFRDGIHGIKIDTQSPDSVKRALERCVATQGELVTIALANMNEARAKYRISLYSAAMARIFDRVGGGGGISHPTGSGVSRQPS